MNIGVDYVRMMARYNAEMNRRLYDVAGRLSDSERRLDRGAFWGSIHGTLAHLVWGDKQWMSRLDGWETNTLPQAGSAQLDREFMSLKAERASLDARMEGWARRIDQAWLDGELSWYSGASGREMTKPLSILVPHLFNHQTHHRGQVHAMLTAAGERVGDTDLPWVV